MKNSEVWEYWVQWELFLQKEKGQVQLKGMYVLMVCHPSRTLSNNLHHPYRIHPHWPTNKQLVPWLLENWLV